MIAVPISPAPAGFRARCHQRGNKWLDANPTATRPRDYWSPFKPALAQAFRGLCAYGAMYSPVGTVDHFRSFKNHPHLAYEWENYRFAEAWINSAKSTVDDEILDPFAVRDGWFEILLPSLNLIRTDRVPARLRPRADRTLARLGIGHDERIVRQRRHWLAMYECGELSLSGLQRVAPLIAQAIVKRDATSAMRGK